MIKKKEIKVKLGAPGKTKNPYLKPNGSFDLIEEFPSYKKKKLKKTKKQNNKKIKE